MQAGSQVNRFEAVGTFAHYLHVILHFDEQAQTLAHHGVVVYQQHGDFFRRGGEFLVHGQSLFPIYSTSNSNNPADL